MCPIKLPRWLVIGMLTSSVLAMLAAAGWWWITWPERTARAVMDRVGEHKFKRVEQYIASTAKTTYRHEIEVAALAVGDGFPQHVHANRPRTLSDIIFSRQEFEITADSFGCNFTIECGKVVESSAWGFSSSSRGLNMTIGAIDSSSRTFRVLFLTSMLVSMAVVIGWAGVVGWRMWPEWRAVREMRRAVEANEPGRFLDAVEAVDRLGVADAARCGMEAGGTPR